MDPPPPPPHGSNQQNSGSGGSNQQNSRSGGLPPGNYDIFVIPPHSSGSGFLYLPSLQTHRNSFLAGVACTASAFCVWSVLVPVLKEWFNTLITSGGPGVMVLVISVGAVAWAFGKTQAEGSGPGSTGPGVGRGGTSGAGTPGGGTFGAGAAPQGPPPPGSSHVPPNGAAPPPPPPPPPPRSSWHRPNPQTFGASNAAKNSWEKAREETRKKEEERKKAEEAKKRREEAERARQRQRERDAREREQREKEKEEAREREQREKEKEKEVQEREQREKDAREREQREKDAREREQREKDAREREQREKDAREREERERKHKAEKAEQERRDGEAAAAKIRVKAVPKNPPNPTARTETDDDAYSFRPYDRPKRPAPKAGSTTSTYSESSYAASQSTARTTPPPSHRGPYHTKDPDKIIIKAVYSFNNAFQRTPVSQLISGQGNVTDGLILRITTEGLFIDDDVRGVPQREWDVKAWTMKTAESCEMSGLHVLRASIRDQEGKKYVFIISQTEGWKVAVGLQRLRRGTQVRAMGVSGMPANEAKALIENLGWA